MSSSTSKNRPCECGSGKKWKHCCGKVVSIATRRTFSDRDPPLRVSLELIPRGLSYSLDELRDDLSINPWLFKDPEFLLRVGADLGSIGRVDLGIQFTLRSIKKDPKNLDARLNLSVMYGQIGEESLRDEEIKKIPKQHLSHNIVYANYLSDRGRTEQAISVYEKIANEGTDFYLVYSNLITCFPERSETRWEWIRRSIQLFPDVPEIFYLMLQSVIFRRDFDNYTVPNNLHLSTARDERVIGGGKDRPQLVRQIHQLHRIIQYFQNRDFGSLSKILLEQEVGGLQHLSPCELLKPALDLSVETGNSTYVDTFFDALCEDCQRPIDIHAAKIQSMLNAPSSSEAAYTYFSEHEDDLKLSKDNLLLNIVSGLDDDGNTRLSLETLEKRDFFRDSSNFYFKFRGIYDGFHYASRQGLPLLALDLVKEAEPIGIEILEYGETIEIDGYTFDPLENLQDAISWISFNKAFTHLGLKQSNDAKEILLKIKSELDNGSEYSDFTREVCREMLDLCDWVEEVSDSITFHNDFSRHVSLHCGSFSNLSGKVVPRNFSSKTDSVINKALFGKQDRLTVDDYAELHRHILSEQNDISEVVNSIENSLPKFRSLGHQVQTCLFESESRLLNQKMSFDIGMMALGYCKSIEIFLRTTVFIPFLNDLLGDVRIDELIVEAEQDKKRSQFSGYLRFVKTRQIELGGMGKTLQICAGKTGDRVLLFKKFREYLSTHHPCLLETESINQIVLLTKDVRNVAAHDLGLTREHLLATRKTIYSLLTRLTNLRIISNS